jgi:hypothetical protein
MTIQTTEQRRTSTLAELEPPVETEPVAVVALRGTEDRNTLGEAEAAAARGLAVALQGHRRIAT